MSTSFFVYLRRHVPQCVFFLLAWLWAAWWMGDVLRTAYEWSFFAPDTTLMRWLWRQSFGSLWLVGRFLLLAFRWPVAGGLLVAAMLTWGAWLVAYCLRLPLRWCWAGYLPAGAWMTWVSWLGLNIYYEFEPGRILGVLFLGLFVCAVDAFVISTFRRRRRPLTATGLPEADHRPLEPRLLAAHGAVIALCFAAPMLTLHLRHPYIRPLTRMQTLMLDERWDDMAATARAHAALSYRPLAAYYAVALRHNGHLTDQLFDIRMEFDSLYVQGYGGQPDLGSNYYETDCSYHAGLFRVATHKAMEHLTMMGPSLFSLKHLTRLALLDGDWQLARKYLHIIGKAPFEHPFLDRYSPMLGHMELVDADPVFARLRRTEPVADSFENQYEQPVFLGYFANLAAGRTVDALQQSLLVNLYSKRMPDFLLRCEALVGTTPPPVIAEGLVTQSVKNENILRAFPQLQMDVQRYRSFLLVAKPYMQDRTRGGDELFSAWNGYYPYYYFFGNLRATRKREDKPQTSSAGVN